MCGICGCYKSTLPVSELRQTLLKCGKKLRHRGPDSNGLYTFNNGCALLHERLSIIDPESGSQPFITQEGIVLSVNGEIYNYKELKKEITIEYDYTTNSDCEVIIPLYLQYGINFISRLNGMFSFILYDINNENMYVIRDHIGITPLYYGYGTDGSIWFASEMKALTNVCHIIKNFSPGNYYNCQENKFIQWDFNNWKEGNLKILNDLNLKELEMNLFKSVNKRMMADVPWGVLLSGGLDSSLIASIISQNIKEPGNLHTFSIGLKGSPDLKSAQLVADYIGSTHHNYIFTIQEGLDALSDVIYHLETYDITTIRASTPMFLLSRKIKSLGIKMVLSGEGADEIFGGYLYFHKAPNSEEFYKETVDKLKKLNLYDCLRANKSSSAWGLEVRVPFLDKEFLNYAMDIDPKYKMINKERPIEKYILRKAFENNNKYLPKEVLWRQKEQFSDGVGNNWIENLKNHAEFIISDRQMEFAHILFPYNTPQTKEGYWYRSIFDKHFPNESYAQTVEQEDTIACSTKRAMEWDENFKNNKDPSGRAVKIHHNSY